MARIVSCGFNEDLDLNAGAAQLAALKNQTGGVTLIDADTIELPNAEGMSIVAMRGCDETAGGTGGYLHFPGLMGDRKFRFGAEALVGDRLVWEILFAPGVFMVPPKQKIKCFGNASGSGAEQHVALVDFIHPGLPDIPTISQGMNLGCIKVGAMTGALVAQTPSGLNSILGDETALADSEIQLPTADGNQYSLLKFGNYPGGAGYGVAGVRAPDGLSDRLFPAVFANAIKGYEWELNWSFKGTAPPRMVGAGVGTTSTEWTVTLGQIS